MAQSVGDPPRTERVARTALAHCLAGLLTAPGAGWTADDLPAVADAATLSCYRRLVAAGAVAAGRVSGEWPPADPDGLSDRLESAYPGWLVAPDADHPGARVLAGNDLAPDRRRAADAALSELVDGGATPGSGPAAAGVPLGAVHEHLLGVEVAAVEDPTAADGDPVVGADEWAGPAVVLAPGDDRKDGGAYYTPPAVVEGVVETALAPVAERIRAGDVDATAGDPGVRVLDPAAGTGRFLVSAVDRLTETVLAARREDDCGADVATADRVRRRVAEHCVYGVDVDPVAIELARATLWLHAGADAGGNLRAGDALLGPGPDPDPDGGADAAGATVGTVADPDRGTDRDGDGDLPRDRDGIEARNERGDLDRPPVDWPAAFPSVLGAGGRFDAVVGNPPYVRSRALPDPVRAALRERYRTVRGAFDLYVPFVERAAALGERVALVVPNKWTTAEYGRDLRASLLGEWGLESVVDCSGLGLFDDADVYPVVVSYAPDPGAGRDLRTPDGAGSTTPDDGVEVRRVGDPADIAPGGGRSLRVPTTLVDSLGGVIPVEMDPDLVDAVERVLRECGAFGEYATMTEGIHTGNARGTLVVEEPVDDRCRPLADGRSIERYRVEPSGEWIRYDPALVGDGEYADLREPSLFEGPKLLVRDISDRPVAAFDDGGLYALNTLYAVHPTGALPAKYLLAVFNSAFVDRLFRAAFGGTHVHDGYLRFKPTYVERLPVPAPDPGRLGADTRRRLAAHPATPAGDPDALDSRTGVTDALAALTDAVAGATATRAAVETDPGAYFDPGGGARLGDLPGVERASGVAATPLAATTRDRTGLRVGGATVAPDGDDLLVRATVRYKPDGGGDGNGNDGDDAPGEDLDRWGYRETDPIPALRVDPGALGERRAAVLRAVVPAVVAGDLGETPATAAKTITPLDRLAGIGVPDPESAAADLAGYRAARRRSGALGRRVAVADRLIDRAVADLYGLDDRERAAVAGPRT